MTRPNAYSATWHAVFGATRPEEATALFETRTGVRTVEREGRSIVERIELAAGRLTTTLDYGSGVEDVFSWQVYTPVELAAVARSTELSSVLVCSEFDESVPAGPEHARMQLVFERS